MGIISLNEKRTSTLKHNTTGKQVSYHVGSQFAEPPAFGGVTTNLEVHYDFSRTDCWNRGTSTNAADYTVHNLAKDYADAIFRSQTGSNTSFRDGSDSPCISFNSSDGGGCLELDPSNHDGDEDDCAVILPGALSSSTTTSDVYNISTVSASSSENILNGVGNGAFTTEIWVRVYADESLGNAAAQLGYLIGRDSAQDDDVLAGTAWVGYYNNAYSNNNYKDALSFIHNTGSGSNAHKSPRVMTNTPGTPANGAGWSDWLHIVLARASGTGNDNWKVYVNNTLEEEYTAHMNFSALNYGRIARLFSATTIRHRLAIWRFYKGKTLSSTEVTTNWNDQKERFGH
tara:strand:- start:2145 stop:3173 length:1029 start_codon:yes stop_codon:yes gene_type:complete